VEIALCGLFVLLMSIGAARDPGSSRRYEEDFLYWGWAILLLIFATIFTARGRDLWFRVVAYPAALLLGCLVLAVDVGRVYGYGWQSVIWVLPFGVLYALGGCAYMFILNGVIPFCWRKIKGPLI
jgi:hypothetical protein